MSRGMKPYPVGFLTKFVASESATLKSPNQSAIPRLHLVGYHERRSILPVAVAQQPIGFFVVLDLLSFRIETERPSKAVRNIGEVNQATRDVTLFNRSPEILSFSAHHAIN